MKKYNTNNYLKVLFKGEEVPFTRLYAKEHPDFMHRVTQMAKDHNLDEKNADDAWGPLPYYKVFWETMKRDNPDLYQEYMDVEQFMKLLPNSPKTLEILNKYHFKPDVIGKYYMVIIEWEDMAYEFHGYDTMWRELEAAEQLPFLGYSMNYDEFL